MTLIAPCPPVLKWAAPEDAATLSALAAVHARAFARGWSADEIGRLIALPGTALPFAEEDVRLLGFLMIRAAGGEAEILTLATAPEARRKGVATSLLHASLTWAAMNGASRVFLEVDAGNAAARTLYEGAGFEIAGRRPHYYRQGMVTADALILALELGDAAEKRMT